LRSAHPAFVRPSEGADEVPQRPEVRPRTGDRAGDEASVLSDRSADDTDLGWGERRPDSNDDRLRQDKPPHW